MIFRKTSILSIAAAILLIATTAAYARELTAGTIVTSPKEMGTVVNGLSVSKTLLGADVLNGSGTKVGKVADLIINKDKSGLHLPYAIIDVGGFLGIGSKQIAVNADKLRYEAGSIIFPGNVTKQMLEKAPEFKYSK